MAEHVPPGPWNEFPELWDRLVLGGREWPGLATVEVSRANKWDTKKAKGSHGGQREFSGVDLAKVRISLRFWEFDAYDTLTTDLLPLIEPDPTKAKRDALSISHAVCVVRKVTQITIDSVDGPKKAEPGIWAFDIDATEYRPPETKNAVGTAKGGKGTGGALSPCANLKALLRRAQDDYATNTQFAEEALRMLDFSGAINFNALATAAEAEVIAYTAQMAALQCGELPPSGAGGTDP